MWPNKMRTEQLVAEARTLRGLIAQTGAHFNLNPKMEWKSSASEPFIRNSLGFRAEAVSFQQRLKLAESQGLTLLEFEKRLA
jgi:hypothetical protein